ncbi:DUF2946 family protein [Oharaeibacter diazotrophicus]|uniref:DUF2946 family protein n=2 Tax=Oharaeibacter diazotrophicus TaxID=1920512 RepID=A0A4V3CW94_9HYPH|nr:DUF2946 family protein [Oharaeibacter diazotrophicus]TDP85458.1 hypothetical protein EDD54_2311 [Oharaeibacter diazotrophicus]BBE74428.1 hypothetical protein OHA_1_04059 [Pleomorphomonas sp. SM30]GLS75876.1 hypothetical protein GCM10007904_12110 [Oharaeibacter diazotrophicus]
MGAALGQGCRMWATILVVYALLLAGLAPALAASIGDPGAGVICTEASSGDHRAPGDLVGHGAACCILCHAVQAPAAPVAETVAAAPLHREAPVFAAVAETPPPRGPPGAAPQSPRAPPFA